MPEDKNGGLVDKRLEPSIYVGETSRSIFERAAEHWKDARGQHEDSHMYKHWAIHHGGMGDMDFTFNIVRGYQDSLSRQVGEAVRVQLRQNVLNSKSIYNRCKLTRLVVDRELLEDKNARVEDNKRDNGEQLEADITLVETGEKRQLVEIQKPGRKKAKLKHPVEDEDWGLVETEQDGTTSFLYQE